MRLRASLLAGDLAGGIWFAFIGWFLVQAARASSQDLQLQQLLRAVEAEEVMAAAREQWPTRQVRDHMVPLGEQVVVAPEARMDGVLS